MIKQIDLTGNEIDIYEQKHMGGHLVSEHYHQTHQLLFVLEGEGAIRLDGTVQPLTVDDTALIVPFSVHSVMSDSRLTLLVLAFDAEALDLDLRTELLTVYFPASCLTRPGLFVASELRQLLRKMLFEQSREHSPLVRLSLKVQLSQLLLLLVRSTGTEAAGAGAYSSSSSNKLRAEKIRGYIDSKYFDPLTAGDIASRLGISTRHVNTIFKERYDMTPMQYLAEVRIRVAQKLLAETGKDIISICFEVGYDSVSTFYRSFKAVTKLSPKSYRELNAQVQGE
ncbi:AraC family transcriptional regulator [Paenibacillus sp. HB172176]|uniref:AraC family transcriptional regulator n=1 Tax=Paenibacillus sp. HB172176 TaxID=2493690 RepID=UPI00143CA2C8|nr:AraC family transcriptional regulator [Paenibacillus sp. HB172176]